MLKKIIAALILGILGTAQQPINSQEFVCEFDQIEMSFIKTRQMNHDLFALHVIPKCGTHFIQRTLQLMTGQMTINRNLNLEKLTEAYNDNKILRTFQPYQPAFSLLLQRNEHKLISVIRDPRDALISHVFYMRNFPKDPNGDNTKRDFFTVGENFDTLSLDKQITSLIKGENGCMSYIDFYKERIGWALDPVNLAIKYEELLGTLGGGDDKIQKAKVKQIAKFIHLKLTSQELQYVLDNMYVDFGENEVSDGRVFERATTGNWHTFLTEKHKKSIKQKIGKEIIQLGYDKDNKW